MTFQDKEVWLNPILFLLSCLQKFVRHRTRRSIRYLQVMRAPTFPSHRLISLLGFVIYFGYGIWHSLVGNDKPQPPDSTSQTWQKHPWCFTKAFCNHRTLMLCGIPLGTAVIFWFKGHLSLWTGVMVFLTDWNLGTGVDKKKAKQRRTWGTQVSSGTRVLYSWQGVLIYCYTRKL